MTPRKYAAAVNFMASGVWTGLVAAEVARNDAFATLVSLVIAAVFFGLGVFAIRKD